jgi:hypothetical protein
MKPRFDGASLARRLCTREHGVLVVLKSAVVLAGDLPDMPFLRKQVAPNHLTQVIVEVLAGNSHDVAMGSTQSCG